MCNYHELVPLHSRIFPPINKFYTALIFIYYFLISTGASYIFFTTKSVTMTRHPLPDLGWNQPVVLNYLHLSLEVARHLAQESCYPQIHHRSHRRNVQGIFGCPTDCTHTRARAHTHTHTHTHTHMSYRHHQ